ncbi:regulation of nuclear pre-mRNA domain-containing protein 2a isoform X2 [Trichomycterus rosablanca]|uniref:regulation of nuclear pre-mRNA domain-containing protein 2a isoform X2 n=1 Tax=Trichomycterus rosablanca TaxID=2290929 RepID=UPI002F35A0FE
MAAGSEAVSGNSRGSAAAFESALDRRLQGLTNTMESIQGLSSWCIENKKYHSVIVRSWLKRVRKSDASHRLNLFYLANDIIQNCKRKNAVVYRTTFTDVLPEAVKLINTSKDSKIRKSVDRILCIWEERNVYPEEIINKLRGGLTQHEEPAAPVNQKAELRSKIVAEFVPSAFTDHLTKYRNSMDEIELREKQLAAMRVDVCSTAALKKLKDKAGGKRFSKDFEDGSAKLRDFVSFLNGEVEKGPALMETLENADIFYEMQYKEVKIVANAYQTFANRVVHLKRKLDALKATLPDPDDSPIPSPSMDAPSPVSSESPENDLQPVCSPDPELDGLAVEEEDLIALGDAPSPLSSPGDRDNRDVEDMELSDVDESAEATIIVEERVENPVPDSGTSETPVAEPTPLTQAAPVKEVTTSAPTVTSAAPSLPVNLAGVDLAKISSILSTLTNVMKNSGPGVSPVSRPSTSTSSTLSTASSSVKSPTVSSSPTAPGSKPLSSILSRVDIKPSTLLNILSKTQGLSSLRNNQTGTPSTTSGSDINPSPDPNNTNYAYASPKTTEVPSAATSVSNSAPQTDASLHSQPPNVAQPSDLPKKVEEKKVEPITSVSSTLDSKIDSFLQENPKLSGFNMGFPTVLPWSRAVDSPSGSTDNMGGTPVRDESGATPTQDEVMDDPAVNTLSYHVAPLQTSASPALVGSSVSGPRLSSYGSNSWQEQNSHGSQYGPGSQSGGDKYQRDFAEVGRQKQHAASLAQSSLASNKQMPAMTNPVKHGQATPYSIGGKRTNNAMLEDKGWYGETYGQEQRVAAPTESYRENQQQSQDPNPPNFFNTPLPPLPPIPQLPPPPQDFIPSEVGGIRGPNPADNFQAGRRSSPYVPGNNFNERFHPHQNVSAHNHGGVPPRLFPPAPQNGPAGYNHHPRVPVLPQRHPGMRPGRPSFPEREYFEHPSGREFSESPVGRGAHAPFGGRGAHAQFGGRGGHAPPGGRGVHVPPEGRGVHERPVGKWVHEPPGEEGIHEPSESRVVHEPPSGNSFHANSSGSGVHEPSSGSGVQEPSAESELDEPPSENRVTESPGGKRVHEPSSESEDLSEDPYLPTEPPHSPQSHTFYADKRPLPQHQPQHRPRLEHRPPPPQHYRGPRPGHFPMHRPLRRPPPPFTLHPSEPPFQRVRRPGPPFGGGPRPGGPCYPPKRPFFQPRY